MRTISNNRKDNRIYVHQIRVDCENSFVDPIPEGIHQDGFDFICICCINKHNIEPVKNEILDLDKKTILIKELDVGECLVLNDRKFYHNVTKLNTFNKKEKGYRDIFVFTTLK